MSSPNTPNKEVFPSKAIIKSVDMTEEMQQQVVQLASEGLERYDVEKDMAMWLKKEADRIWGTTWHCVVGKNFGSFVTHDEEFHLLLPGTYGYSALEDVMIDKKAF